MHYLIYVYWKVLATHHSFERINEFTRWKREHADKPEKKYSTQEVISVRVLIFYIREY